jgi:hypothetical protein
MNDEVKVTWLVQDKPGVFSRITRVKVEFRDQSWMSHNLEAPTGWEQVGNFDKWFKTVVSPEIDKIKSQTQPTPKTPSRRFDFT